MNVFWICLLTLFMLGEIYYWFWWLPRHWKEVPDARNIVFAYNHIYRGPHPDKRKAISRRRISK